MSEDDSKERNSLILYENETSDEKGESLSPEESNPNYKKIRSYLILLRSNISDQKDMAENFFKHHKKESMVYENLYKITENLFESEDVRLQAVVMLQRLYNVKGKKLKYIRPQDDLEIVHDENNTPLAIGDARETLENLHHLKERKQNKLIDSLPYIDQHYKEETFVKEEMNRLLKEEINKLAETKTPQDYLEHHPYPSLEYLNDPLINDEIKRIEAGKKLNIFHTEIDTKFEDPAPNKYHDYSNWKHLIKNVNLSLQQYNVKNLNLDLLIKFGPDSWKKYLTTFESIVTQLENEKKELENQNAEINRERKLKQVEALDTLNDKQSKLQYYIHQNMDIQKECLKLRYKIKKLIKYKKRKLRLRRKEGKLNKQSNLSK